MMRWQADQTSSALVSLSSCLSARVCRVVRRHPEQKKYMLSKEKVYASSSSEGKGIRMIIDFLRDPMSCPVSEARAIIDEKPAFTSGLEKFEMDVHDQQLDWLSEELGIKLADSQEPAERYAVRGPLLVAAFPAPRLRAAVSHTLGAAVRESGASVPGLGDADGEGGGQQGLPALRDRPLPQLLKVHAKCTYVTYPLRVRVPSRAQR